MGLFSRDAAGTDIRDRDYLLTGCPLVAADDRVVLVDATVRLAVRPPRDDGWVPSYDAAEEPTVHAICVLLLRQLAAGRTSEELLVGRALVVEAVERGLTLAPVGSGVDARVVDVAVRPHAAGSRWDHEFVVADR